MVCGIWYVIGGHAETLDEESGEFNHLLIRLSGRLHVVNESEEQASVLNVQPWDDISGRIILPFSHLVNFALAPPSFRPFSLALMLHDLKEATHRMTYIKRARWVKGGGRRESESKNWMVR